MLRTMNRIHVNAPPGAVFDLAADVWRWPELLPHYRYVKVVQRDPVSHHRVVRMGARRGRIPVRWSAEQECRPDTGSIAYRHIAGVTRGMNVEWRIQPQGDGCAVSISHELLRPQGILRIPFADWVVGQVFVKVIAQSTLDGIRKHAEALAPSVPVRCEPAP